MSAKNRKRISGEEAIQNMLQFVEEESGDEESDLDELYRDENEINSETNFPVRVATLKKKMMTLTQMKMQILSLDVNIGVSN